MFKNFYDIFETKEDRLLANRPAILLELYEAHKELLEFVIGYGSDRIGNPYLKPEVKRALTILAKIQGHESYLDAETTLKEGRD